MSSGLKKLELAEELGARYPLGAPRRFSDATECLGAASTLRHKQYVHFSWIKYLQLVGLEPLVLGFFDALQYCMIGHMKVIGGSFLWSCIKSRTSRSRNHS
jgi:hypothetical protein